MQTLDLQRGCLLTRNARAKIVNLHEIQIESPQKKMQNYEELSNGRRHWQGKIEHLPNRTLVSLKNLLSDRDTHEIRRIQVRLRFH